MTTSTQDSTTNPIEITYEITVTIDNADAQPVEDIGALVGAVSAKGDELAALVVEACARPGASVDVAATFTNVLGGTGVMVKADEA